MRYSEILNEASGAPDALDQLVQKFNGVEDGEVYWNAKKSPSGKVEISWSLTFRRDTSEGAFKSYKSTIKRANDQLVAIADEFESNLITLDPLTLEKAKELDSFKEGNGDDAYSEYEQSFGGSITLKGSPKAGMPKRNLHDMLSKKLSGKKVGPIVWEVTTPQTDGYGDELFNIRWKLPFSSKNTNRDILTKYEAQIAKVEGIMQELATKYASYLKAYGFYPLDRKELISIDQYRASHDPVRDTSIGNKATFYVSKPKKKK